MIALALWFLASFGFAFVVGHSKISLPFRQWLGGWTESSVTNDLEGGQVIGQVIPHKPMVPVLGPFLVALAECPGCLGWWAGFGAVFLWPALMRPFGLSLYASVLLLAFATSAVNLLLAKYVGMV